MVIKMDKRKLKKNAKIIAKRGTEAGKTYVRRRIIIVAIILFIITLGVVVAVQFIPFMINLYDDGGSGDGYVSYESLPSRPVLNDIQPDPNIDGSISLVWSASERIWFYNVYRKKSGYTEEKIKYATTSTSFIDAAAKTNGLYYYRIEAVNNIGDIYSSSQSVRIEIAALPTTSREADLYSVVVAADGSTVLRWTIESTTSHTDKIERKIDGGTWSEVGMLTTSGGGTWTDTLINYGSYGYRIKSMYNMVIRWDTYYSKEVWVLFAGIVPDATTVSTITPNPDTDGSVIISWASVPNVPNYELHKSIDNVVFTKLTTVSSTSFTDSGLSDGTYYYKVKCIGVDYDSGFSNVESVRVQQDIYVPIIPVATIVHTISPDPDDDGEVQISWDTISDADEYELHRSIDSVRYTILTTITSTVFTDYGLSDGLTYYYKVKCIGLDGDSGFSNVKSVVITFPVLVPPTNPSILINNGESTTNSLDITVKISCTDATTMRFKLSSDTSWTSWERYGTSRSFTLPEVSLDNPNFNVAVQFQNADGETGETDAVDGITYVELEEEEEEEEETTTEPLLTTEQIVILVVILSLAVSGVIIIQVINKRRKLKPKI